MSTFKDILILLAVLIAYGIVGRMDYEDAVRHEEFMRTRQLDESVCAHFTSADRPDAAIAAINAPSVQDAYAGGCTTSPL